MQRCRLLRVAARLLAAPPALPCQGQAAAAASAALRRAASSDSRGGAGGSWASSLLEETARRHDGDGTAAFLDFDGQEEEDEDDEDDEDVVLDEESWEEVLTNTVVSRPVWPPPAAALAANPDLASLMEEVRQSQAPQLGLVTDRERSERVERVKAFALRFVETCADKVSLTARPSLTLSLLKMQLTMAQLCAECEALGIPEELYTRKGVLKADIAELVFNYTTATPEAFPSFDAEEDKRRTGLPLPWAEVLRRRMATQSALEKQPDGIGTLAQLSDRLDDSPAKREPLRERKQYARIVAAEAVARMLAHAHASDVTLIKVDSACTWTDAFVIASARSEPHLQALAGASLHLFSEARAAAAKAGWGGSGRPAAIEGGRAAAESPEWLVVDMDSVVVHLFRPEMRAEYALEQLWGVEHGCEVVYFDSKGDALPAKPSDDALPPPPASPGVPPSSSSSSPASTLPPDASWQPVLFDRRDGRLRSFQGSPLPNIAPSLEAEPSSSSSDEDDDDEEEPTPEQIEEQARALARYVEASGRHEERLSRSELRLRERAKVAAERRLAKRKAIAAASAEQQSGDSWGGTAEGIEPAPPALGTALSPSGRTQRQLLVSAVERGVDFGPGAGRGRHEAGCGCAACTAVRKGVTKVSAMPESKTETSETGRLVLCPPTCLCTRCAWLRWRVVAFAQRDEAAAAQLGLLYIRRGRHKGRTLGATRAKAAAKAEAEERASKDAAAAAAAAV